MKKYLGILLAFFTVTLSLIFNQQAVSAASTSNVNYSISAELPDNQAASNISYFDLKVAPNQKETIKFKINNNDVKDHTYKVAVNRATTDSNGVIIYNQHDVQPDDSLIYNIEDLVKYPKEVTVDKNSSKEIAVDISMPKEKFSGVLLGGILVEENNQINGTQTVKGVTLKNKYDYVLGLQLQESTDIVKPDLKFVKAYQTSNQGQIYIAGELDNDVPTLEKNVSVDAKITHKNSPKIVLKSSKKNMSIAPNSNFDYPVNVNSTNGTDKNKRLKPGTYTMYLNVKSNNGNDHWNLKRNFTITSKQNSKINKKIPDRSKDIWIILGVIAILISVAISVIWNYRKKRN